MNLHSRKPVPMVLILVLGVGHVGQLFAGPVANGSTRRVTILSAGCRWRKHYTFFPPQLSVAAATKAGLATDTESRTKYLTGHYRVPRKYRIVFGVKGRRFPNCVTGFRTEPPAAGWKQPSFDDSGWLGVPGAEFTGMRSTLVRPARGGWANELPPPARERMAAIRGMDPFAEEVGLICMRGKFLVTDRRRARKLTLSLSYRGGFVAYLNGTEIARSSLPEGALDPTMPAEDYPLEAFVGPGGEPPLDQWLSTDYELEKLESRWAARERHFGPKVIDRTLVRDGMNVLAIELHRSNYPAECAPKKLGLCFGTVGLGTLSLAAEMAAGGVVASTERPDGVQIWNQHAWMPVLTTDYGDPAERPGPVRIVGARNGVFSGQVVIGATKPIEALRAEVGALVTTGGKRRAEIPSSALQVRFGVTNPTRDLSPRDWGFSWLTGLTGRRSDSLLSRAPDRVEVRGAEETVPFIRPWAPVVREAMGLPPKPVAGAVLPVWVSVRVPKTAAAGDYRGKLTIAARSFEPIEVPIELHVSDWTLPDPKDYGSVTFIYQSPDTLAEYYGVEPWSDAHWRLIEQSLKLLGEIGNNGVVLPLLARTQFGNAESMVRWARQPSGAWKHDFTIFDRYLEAVLRTHDPRSLKVIGLLVWFRQLNEARNAFVTVVDAATGKKDRFTLPTYGTKECEELLRPVLRAVHERLRRKGLADRLTLGMSDDRSPHPDHVAMFHRILPDAPWFAASHGARTRLACSATDRAQSVRVACCSVVYCSPVPDPAVRRAYGWQQDAERMSLVYNRENTRNVPISGFPEPWAFRMWRESAIAGGLKGNGHIGGDYFLLGKDDSGPRCIFSRYPTADVTNLGLRGTTPDLIAPGPNGPVASVRLENAREGIQEAEARIFIERALLDKDNPLPADLARRCQAILDARTTALRMWNLNSLLWHWRRGTTEVGALGWRESTRHLFDAAAEIASLRPKD